MTDDEKFEKRADQIVSALTRTADALESILKILTGTAAKTEFKLNSPDAMKKACAESMAIVKEWKEKHYRNLPDEGSELKNITPSDYAKKILASYGGPRTIKTEG